MRQRWGVFMATSTGNFSVVGDIGHYDEDGHFFVMDRVKELIKYKAYQVMKSF